MSHLDTYHPGSKKETTMPTPLIDTKPMINGHAPPATAQTARPRRTLDARQRRAEIVIAALFLLTAATSMFGAFAVEPGLNLNALDYLAKIFPNKTTLVVDALLWSFNNLGIVFVAVFAFPLLRKLDEALAVGYLASRIIEGTIMMVGIMATLLLIPLSRQFLAAGAPQDSWFQTLGDVLMQVKFLGLTAVSLPLLGLGGVFFTWQLFRFRLVPRLISAWGLIGYGLLIPASIAGWFGLIDVAPASAGIASLLAVPVASFEIILLPFWLLFRGFKMPETTTAATS
jgi:hypothetical protein